MRFVLLAVAIAALVASLYRMDRSTAAGREMDRPTIALTLIGAALVASCLYS